MGEPAILIAMATLIVVAAIIFLSWVLVFRPRQVKKLHDEVIDQTTRDVLEACLAYGQSRLTGAQYEVFKDLLTDQINNGEGGITLARLVEDCIARAQGEVE